MFKNGDRKFAKHCFHGLLPSFLVLRDLFLTAQIPGLAIGY